MTRHRAENTFGDAPEDRQLITYQWHDVAYGPANAPAIEIRVRFNPDTQPPEFILHELTRAWMAICRSINNGGTYE